MKALLKRAKIAALLFVGLTGLYYGSRMVFAQAHGVTPTAVACGSSGQLMANMSGTCTGITVGSPMQIVAGALVATQAQADWTEGTTSAPDYILHKPTLISSFINDTNFITLAAIPTNISYFTDDANYVTAASVAATYFAKPTGTSAQYINGVGTATSFPTIVNYCYEGTTKHTNCVTYSNALTVSSGTVTANFTTDGTSTGPSVFPTGNLIVSSMNISCNDNSVPYSASFPGGTTSSTKSVVFTVNKSSGILTVLTLSVLGAPAAANGSTCNIQATGY